MYPVLLLAIGGFIGWGYSPHQHKAIEDHSVGLTVFILLSIAIFALGFAMFYRLEASSGRRNRKRLFTGTNAHARGWHLPWDSYMWGAGTLHILEFVIFLGIALPVLHDNSTALYIVGITWCIAFGVWVACVLYLLHHDPSKGQEEEVWLTASDGQAGACLAPAVKDGTSAPVAESAVPMAPAIHKWCNICKKWYPGTLRKHCYDCNKCVTGFDHHCPFLNQCIGETNYKPFMALLFACAAVHILAIGVGMDVLFEMWGDKVETDAREKWGRSLFVCLIVFMITIAVMLVGPLLALLWFQMQLIYRSWKTGRPETTYMYTPDHKGRIRGVKAYLDVSALDTISQLVLRLHLDRATAFDIWKHYSRQDADERNQQAIVDGMSLATEHGLRLVGSGLRDHSNWVGGSAPSEADPLLPPSLEDEDGIPDAESLHDVTGERDVLIPNVKDKKSSVECGPCAIS